MLTNGKLKSNLTKFYPMFLAESAHSLVDEGTSIIVSGRPAFEVNLDKVAYIRE